MITVYKKTIEITEHITCDLRKGQDYMEGGSVKRPICTQSPIDVDQTTLTGPTREAASMLGGKRLKFNWDEQSRG